MSEGLNVRDPQTCPGVTLPFNPKSSETCSKHIFSEHFRKKPLPEMVFGHFDPLPVVIETRDHHQTTQREKASRNTCLLHFLKNISSPIHLTWELLGGAVPRRKGGASQDSSHRGFSSFWIFWYLTCPCTSNFFSTFFFTPHSLTMGASRGRCSPQKGRSHKRTTDPYSGRPPGNFGTSHLSVGPS